jgi:hypothetical protein
LFNEADFRSTFGSISGFQISVAVQCLSTDFSDQKGVKGQALHIQVIFFCKSLQEFFTLKYRNLCTKNKETYHRFSRNRLKILSSFFSFLLKVTTLA